MKKYLRCSFFASRIAPANTSSSIKKYSVPPLKLSPSILTSSPTVAAASRASAPSAGAAAAACSANGDTSSSVSGTY